MNNSIAKKLRKYARRNYRIEFNNAVRLLSGLELRYRIKYALGIIFKRYKKNDNAGGANV